METVTLYSLLHYFKKKELIFICKKMSIKRSYNNNLKRKKQLAKDIISKWNTHNDKKNEIQYFINDLHLFNISIKNTYSSDLCAKNINKNYRKLIKKKGYYNRSELYGSNNAHEYTNIVDTKERLLIRLKKYNI